MTMLDAPTVLKNSLKGANKVTGPAATIFSVATIAAFILIGFGVRFAIGTEHRKNGLLMTVAGVVILSNVLVWTL
jgi:hypothetical protein